MRRARWIALGLVVLVLAGAVVLAVLERPELDDDRSAVSSAWAPLRAPLLARYDKLGSALGAFAFAGGADRAVAKDLRTALSHWAAATKHHDVAAEVAAADDLEAQGTRLRANVLGSQRLKELTPLTDAVAAFDAAAPPPALVDAYNHKVKAYQDARTSTAGAPVARVLGFGERPALVLGS
jgi:hypothetical protein